jgi:hypothetical protein
MTSPNTLKDSRVDLHCAVGKEDDILFAAVTVTLPDLKWAPQTFYADSDCPEEVAAFYDDVTHCIRQQAKSICEAVYELAAFQPTLLS